MNIESGYTADFVGPYDLESMLSHLDADILTIDHEHYDLGVEISVDGGQLAEMLETCYVNRDLVYNSMRRVQDLAAVRRYLETGSV